MTVLIDCQVASGCGPALREPGSLLEMLIPPCSASALCYPSAGVCGWPPRLIAHIAARTASPDHERLTSATEGHWRWEYEVTRLAETDEALNQDTADSAGGLMTEIATVTATITPRGGQFLDAEDTAIIGVLMSLTRRLEITTHDPLLRIFSMDAVWDEVAHAAEAQEIAALDPLARTERLADALRCLAAIEIETDTAIRRVSANGRYGGNTLSDGARRRVSLRVTDTWAVSAKQVAVRWGREAYAAIMDTVDKLVGIGVDKVNAPDDREVESL